MHAFARFVLAAGLLGLPLVAHAKQPGGRLYIGGATARQSDGGGEAGLLGWQSFTERGATTATFWGIEVAAVKVGSGALPFITGDFGLRWMPFPDAVVRPYAKVNGGITLVLILPVPSLAAGVGVAVPIGDFSLDLGLGARQVVNLFDTSRNTTLGILEIGLGL